MAAGGGYFPAAKKCSSIAAGRPTRIVTSALDITERKRHEQQIERLTAMYLALSQVNHAIVQLADHDRLFPEVCRIIVQIGGFGLAWIGKLDPAGCLREVARDGEATGFLDDPRVTALFAEAHSTMPFARAAREGVPVIGQDGPMGEVAAHLGLGACMSVPIAGGGVRGVLVVGGDYLERHRSDEREAPLSRYEDVAFREALVAAIELLPPREKLLISLYYVQALQVKEIAAVLDVSESRVNQLRVKAAARLRETLKDW